MPRRREGTLLPLELSILEAGLELQAADGDFYGFALAKRIAEHAGDSGALTAHGTLYKALGRLTEAGLLESEWEDPAASEREGRPRRRLYRVSGLGERAASAAAAAQAAARAAAAPRTAPVGKAALA
ncbi:PadR family transcriptional regulator [Agromyces archimandritae]|uniref:Helix-turn-helix transcriptional regulator n=1 Tax=Agromyces archimandritae TaxID=2781962 RepID=A0A975IPS0_9MICO|nr:helix-turn-helix transcriptional regulator [Agromyces archimandritae]QTX05933.1 helix-turn-helix transcriptional regulator [Agromyces archimandritae]